MVERVLKFLAAAGLEYERPDRVDIAFVRNLPVTLVFLPAADIAQYVGEGNVDLGITGEDIVAESGLPVTTEMALGFGKCRLSVLVPTAHADRPVGHYAGSRVVTSFPHVAKQFFGPLDCAASEANGSRVNTSIKCAPRSVRARWSRASDHAVMALCPHPSPAGSSPARWRRRASWASPTPSSTL